MQKKMQEKALLPSHKDVQGRLRPISAAHLPHTELSGAMGFLSDKPLLSVTLLMLVVWA